MKIIPKRSLKGFTLVELMFVLLSFSLLMTALISITSGGLQTYRKGIAQTEMKEKMRRAAYMISTDLRQAIPVSGTAGFISPLYSSSATTAVTDLHFMRYKAASSSPTTSNPDTNVEIRYQFVANASKAIDGASTYDLIRTEIQSGTTKTETVADYLIVNTTTPTAGSYFAWQTHPMDSSIVDNDTLVINLISKKYTGGKVVDSLTFNTKATVRSAVNMQSGSAYGSNILQISNFASAASSLTNPSSGKKFPN